MVPAHRPAAPRAAALLALALALCLTTGCKRAEHDPALIGTFEARGPENVPGTLLHLELGKDGGLLETITVPLDEGSVVITIKGGYDAKAGVFHTDLESVTPEYNVPDSKRTAVALRVAPIVWIFRAQIKNERPYSYTVNGDRFDLTDGGGTLTHFYRTARADGTAVPRTASAAEPEAGAPMGAPAPSSPMPPSSSAPYAGAPGAPNPGDVPGSPNYRPPSTSSSSSPSTYPSTYPSSTAGGAGAPGVGGSDGWGSNPPVVPVGSPQPVAPNR